MKLFSKYCASYRVHALHVAGQVARNAPKEEVIKEYQRLMARINRKNGKSEDAAAARKKVQTSFNHLAQLGAASASKDAQKAPVSQLDRIVEEVSNTSNVRAYLKVDLLFQAVVDTVSVVDQRWHDAFSAVGASGSVENQGCTVDRDSTKEGQEESEQSFQDSREAMQKGQSRRTSRRSGTHTCSTEQ